MKKRIKELANEFSFWFHTPTSAEKLLTLLTRECYEDAAKIVQETNYSFELCEKIRQRAKELE